MVKKKEFRFEAFKLRGDSCNIVSYCSVKGDITPKQVVNLRVDSLRDVVNLLETTDYEYVDMSVFGNELPVIFGVGNTGIAIAPRTQSKEEGNFKNNKLREKLIENSEEV